MRKNWKRLGVLEHHHLPDFPRTLPAIPADHAKLRPALLRCHFYLGFRFLLVHATSLLVLHHFIFLLLVEAGCCVGVTASCDEGVGDVGEDELEELVDRPETTYGT